MRKIARIIIVLCLSAAGAALAAQAKLTIVTPGILPVSYEADGKVMGFGTDLTNEIFSRLKTPIEISIVPSSRALTMIEDGTADALFALAKTAEREAFAIYPTEAFIEQPIALYVLKDSPITFSGDIKALSGYSIGIIRGGRFSPDFDDAIKNKMFPKLNEVNDYSQNILMLDMKRIDIAIGPRYSILFAAKETGKAGMIKELATPLTKSSPAYLVLSKKGKAAALAAQVDATLKAMKKDGSYDKIMQKYFQ